MNAGGVGLLVLVGPSGAGKTTLAEGLVWRYAERFRLSVSVTTRRPRSGERQGREYHFVSRGDFEGMIEAGKFAEWAEVHGEYYGTVAKNLAPAPANGRIPVLDIDVQGARQVMEKVPDAVVVFILPPGPVKWIERLSDRGTESPGEIGRRLRTAIGELRCTPSFEKFVVNVNLDRALREILAFMNEGADNGCAAGRAGPRPPESPAPSDGSPWGRFPDVATLCRELEIGALAEIKRLEGHPDSASPRSRV